MIKRILIKPIFGANSEAILEDGGKIIIKLFQGHMEIVTQYKYHGFIDEDDKSLGKKDLIVSENSFTSKDKIGRIGMAYDNTAERYFIAIQCEGKSEFCNVADFAEGKSILDDLTSWWLNLRGPGGGLYEKED